MRRAFGVLVVIVGLWCVPRAHADGAADREQARREFAAGQVADQRRDWQAAIEHYLRANDLVPHPNAVFNIATDYERLGKFREAAVWYGRYIEPADSPDREKIVRTLRELAAKPGTLTVRSTPPGLRVAVDDAVVGVTPFSSVVKGGVHRVAIETERREVTIEFGEPAVVDVEMPRASGTLRVVGAPAGARVTVDRRPAGTIPMTLSLAPGVHAVRVTLDGYAPFDTAASIEPNRERVVDAQLARALGTLGGSMRVGYLVGAGGGLDVRGEGALLLAELGVHVGSYDVSSRVGKAAGHTAIDLLFRVTLGEARFAPFVSAGYAFVTASDTAAGTGSGYLLTGGLRWNVAKGFAVLAESGLRYYSNLAATADAGTGLIVPVMASLQITYR